MAFNHTKKMSKNISKASNTRPTSRLQKARKGDNLLLTIYVEGERHQESRKE